MIHENVIIKHKIKVKVFFTFVIGMFFAKLSYNAKALCRGGIGAEIFSVRTTAEQRTNEPKPTQPPLHKT